MRKKRILTKLNYLVDRANLNISYVHCNEPLNFAYLGSNFTAITDEYMDINCMSESALWSKVLEIFTVFLLMQGNSFKKAISTQKKKKCRY